jgi:D-glycero-D-manno-heptose 1,7-bisphosphate phosphatase
VKVVFLDRDGVINKKIENGYVLDWKDFKFLPDVIEAIKLLNKKNIPVFIATNQSAVHRGLISYEKLHEIHQKMIKQLQQKGARIDDIFICPHRPDEKCACRKPGTGLFEQAGQRHDIDFKDSWFIGDSEIDIKAGKKIGCKTYLLGKKENLKQVIESILERKK